MGILVVLKKFRALPFSSNVLVASLYNDLMTSICLCICVTFLPKVIMLKYFLEVDEVMKELLRVFQIILTNTLGLIEYLFSGTPL